MSCLTLIQTIVEQLTLAVTPGSTATLAAGTPPSAQVTPGPLQLAVLAVGEVCTVCGEELVVLAGRDGPFRNRAGGFFLLDPDRCPPD